MTPEEIRRAPPPPSLDAVAIARARLLNIAPPASVTPARTEAQAVRPPQTGPLPCPSWVDQQNPTPAEWELAIRGLPHMRAAAYWEKFLRQGIAQMQAGQPTLAGIPAKHVAHLIRAVAGLVAQETMDD